jgi:CubicO group peptidase (beta-lactamase class C family)
VAGALTLFAAPLLVTQLCSAASGHVAEVHAAEGARSALARLLDDGQAPGLQYVVVNADRVLFAWAGGWGDLAGRRPMESTTTLMAYSMSKTLTAVAVLQLVEAGKVGLDEPLARYTGPLPYGAAMTVRQVLTHTAGLPNPLPLRWVHPAAVHPHFDDGAALDAVLRAHPELSSPPGERYRYSNVGYWLLGRLIERASGEPFPAYMRAHVFAPLRIGATDLDYVVPDGARHAQGYLERLSLMHLLAPLVIDGGLLGESHGRWTHIRPHYVNGAAFGGAVGTAHGFAAFLQDQLRSRSAVLGPEGNALLRTPQRRSDGQPIAITLGWHVDHLAGQTVLFKEGGGAGFHAMMRLYPDAALGTVLMTNATGINVRRVVDRIDASFVVGNAVGGES